MLEPQPRLAGDPGGHQRPFPQEEWDAFLSASPWYESQKFFLRDQMQRFRATDRLAVATCDYRQGLPMSQSFAADKPPWVLNSRPAGVIRQGRAAAM